jgi:hypothetical protein
VLPLNATAAALPQCSFEFGSSLEGFGVLLLGVIGRDGRVYAAVAHAAQFMHMPARVSLRLAVSVTRI